jgi:HD-like signal output (HDOD) protein
MQEKAINTIVLEKIIAGQNHAEIGSLIAEKWDFPEIVKNTIKYHHSLEYAPVEVKKLTTVVYFANMLANYQDKIVEYYQFDLNILSVFGIEEEKQLKKISDKLLEAFTR